MAVPLLDLKAQYAALRGDLVAAATRVLDSGRFILGPECAAFETEFAAACGVALVAGVSSGTQALELGLEACGVGPGDEVIVPAFTFVATATAVSVLGAEPVFADIDPATLTLDPKSVERALSPRTKAMIPVHLFGRPADMDPLLALARAKGLKVIEDCAQAHLARYRGRPVGGLGDCGAFSFYPSKNLGALGDAGALCTRSAELNGLFVMLRNCGRRPGEQYDHARIGHNFRLDELQAAFLRAKLGRLEAWTGARRAAAERYRRGLAGLPLALPAPDGEGSRSVYHIFAVRTGRRDALKARLESVGIGTAVYYPRPLHLLEAYRRLGHRAGDFPEAERAAGDILALPMYAELTPAQIDEVVARVREFFSA